MKKEKAKKGILEDSAGNNSSKRVAGITALGVGLIMGIVLFSFSIIKPIGDSDTALSVMDMFLISGGGLLGIGVMEGFRRKRK